jgi:haloalkane dehalogenase
VDVVRTPDERFANVPDFGYQPSYAEISDQDGGSLRIAYIEHGDPSADPVLLLHGEPSWSFLYRKMIEPIAAAGHRVIAPDLVGFGRSDKPTRTEDHSYARHVEWIRALIFDELSLDHITVVGQDWGGLIGLRLVGEHPARFSRVVAANTGLPTGDHPMPEIWHQFRTVMQTAPTIDVGRFVQAGCKRPMSDEIRAGYDAPFPDPTFQAAARAMPGLVPITPDDPASAANRAAWTVLTQLPIPFLVAFSDSDPITGPMREILVKAMPGAQGRQHPVIENAGHFLQEDAGEELAACIVDFLAATY